MLSSRVTSTSRSPRQPEYRQWKAELFRSMDVEVADKRYPAATLQDNFSTRFGDLLYANDAINNQKEIFGRLTRPEDTGTLRQFEDSRSEAA
jgi:hypothetical protein